MVSTVLCNSYFSPCGSIDGVHLPMSLCEEECIYVSDKCSELWLQVQQVMAQQDIEVVHCNQTTSRFNGLSACCSGFGIYIPQDVTTEGIIN